MVVIGCGDPGLIDMYAEATGCQFPVYADPTRRLYSELGMVRSLALGTRPAYMSKGLLASSVASVVQGLKQIPKGLALKGGDQKQIGGEFLFEPDSVRSPVVSPFTEENKTLGDGVVTTQNGAEAVGENGAAEKKVENGTRHDDDGGPVEEKRVTWCHRMKTTRDHAEIPELMEVLGLDGHGQPIDDKKRWSKALNTRKGTGLSLASQMSQMQVGTTSSAAQEA